MASKPPPARRAAAPAGWLAAYDDFITKNVGQVSQIESTLRSLTYIVPGRFRDAEMASEAIHAGVQLLALYHDQLLQRVAAGRASISRARPGPPGPLLAPGPPPSPHTRYTRYWTHKSALYRRAAVTLQVLRYTELLCEMAAKRRGERVRWRVVVLIEAAKALCRLLLLRVTGGRTTVEPPLPERQALDVEEEGDDDEEEMNEEEEEDTEKTDTNDIKNTPPTPPLSPVSASKTLSSPAGNTRPLPPSPPSTTAGTTGIPPASPHQPWPMPRTGLALPPLPPPGDNITGYLLSRVLTADAIRPPTTLVSRPRAPAPLAAEVLHILVPLVYAVALAQTARARQQKSKVAAWAPWILGIAMETAARQLRARDGLRTTTLERDEWTRRGWALGWWAMRGACYDHAVQGVVAGVRARLPGFVAGIVEDYEYLWANYYFSTSP